MAWHLTMVAHEPVIDRLRRSATTTDLPLAQAITWTEGVIRQAMHAAQVAAKDGVMPPLHLQITLTSIESEDLEQWLNGSH